MSHESSHAALQSSIAALKLVGKTGDSWRNHAVAQNTLQDELGEFPANFQSHYELDEATRDRLLAHTRQDSAHALLNTISLLLRLQWLQRQLTIFMLVTVGLLTAIAWKLWH